MTAARFARNTAAAAFVLLLHAGALWAFNHGLMHKPAPRQSEHIVMAQLIAPEPLPLGEEGAAPAGEPAAAPEPPAAPPAPPPPPKEKPKPKPRVQKPKPPKPRPVAKPEPSPEPAPLAVADSEAARAAHAPVVAAPPAPPAPAESNNASAHHAAAHHGGGTGGGGGSGSSGHGKGSQGSGTGGGGVVPPSSNAAYLRNPKPAYPPMSRRLGETGRSVIRVLVGADGSAKSVRLQRSSGFDRLDQAALDAVRRWRFVPGTRGGVPEDMWFNVPIVWQLN